MNLTIEATRRHLRKALDRDLALYERYVTSNVVLAQYVELTKQALLHVVEEVFEEKRDAIKARPKGGQAHPNTSFIRQVQPGRH